MTTSVLKMQRELVAVTEERDRLAAELRKLREQEPVAMISQNDAGQISIKNHDGTFFDMSKHVGCQFYAAPVAAPSVPEEWLEAGQRLIDAAGDKTCSSLRCNYPMDCCSHELIGAMDAMSALLQSAKPTHTETKENKDEH